MGYAPVDDPQMVVVVLLLNIWGMVDAAAAPLAKEMIEAFIQLNSNVEDLPEHDH